jgi:hypothetical protein
MLVKFKPMPVEATPTVRDDLKRAHDALAAAERALEKARAATENGRKFLDDLVRESERHEAVEKQFTESIATNLKAALQSGASPTFGNEREASKNAAGRAEIETRRAVAVRIVEDLRNDERLAEQELADAKKGVEAGVKDVLKAEAVALADAWKPIDDAARAMRARLGRHHGPVSRLLTSSPTISAAISANEDDQFDLAAVRAADDAWTTFAASLLTDPNAQLYFPEATP